MPYVDTTRTATSTADISLAWSWTVYPSNLIPFTLKVGKVDGSIGGHMGWSATWAMSMTNTVRNRPGNPWSWQILLTVNVANGNGQTASNTITIASGTETTLDYRDLSGTITGAWTASVGTNILWNINETGYSSTTAPTQFPSATSYTQYEQAQPGAVCVATLNMFGTATTATGTVGTSGGNVATHDFQLGLSQRCEDTGSASCSVSNIKVNGITPYSATHSHSYDRQTAGNWATSGTSNATEATTVGLSSSARLAAKVNLQEQIRAWNGSYPNALTVRVYGFDAETIGYRDITGTGSVSGSDDLYKYSFISTITTGSGSSNLTTALNGVPTSISAAITTSSLVTNGDYSGDTRLLFRGWNFGGWTITGTGTYAVLGSGNDRTYSTPVGLSSYRYLDIQVKAQITAPVTGTLEITDFKNQTKTWNITATATTYNTITIDLCSPNVFSAGALPTTDGKDDPYPRLNTASTSYAGSESTDSAYWGITSAKRIRIATGAIDLGTVTLRSNLVDQTYVYDTFTAAAQRVTPSIVSSGDTTTYYYTRRFWHLDADGKNEEEGDVWWQMTVGGVTGTTTYTVQPLSIADLAGQIQALDSGTVRHPGWTASRTVVKPTGTTCTVSFPPLRDCYLNGDTGYATWLYGGGMLATPNATSGTDWTYAHQVSVGSVTAQTLFDSINGDFVPDINDTFSVNGGTDVGLYLVGGTVLRGIAHGALLDSAGAIATSGTVNLKLAFDNSVRGTDSSLDADGRYYTDSPWGFGEYAHNITQASNTISLTPLHTSKRHRGWFKVVSDTGSCGTIDTAPNQMLCYGNIQSGRVRLHFADGPQGTNWREVITSITGASCVNVRYDTVQAGLLWVLVEKTGGGLDLYYTSDEGGTCTLATTVSATGTNGAIGISPTGKRIVAWYASSGINRIVYDPQGNVVTSASTIVSSGAAADCISLTWRLDVWYLVYRATATGITLITSTDDGETWS